MYVTPYKWRSQWDSAPMGTNPVFPHSVAIAKKKVIWLLRVPQYVSLHTSVPVM